MIVVCQNIFLCEFYVHACYVLCLYWEFIGVTCHPFGFSGLDYLFTLWRIVLYERANAPVTSVSGGAPAQHPRMSTRPTRLPILSQVDQQVHACVTSEAEAAPTRGGFRRTRTPWSLTSLPDGPWLRVSSSVASCSASATRARKRHGRVKTGNGQDDRILSPLSCLPAGHVVTSPRPGTCFAQYHTLVRFWSCSVTQKPFLRKNSQLWIWLEKCILDICGQF